jgi:hypothetical protein
MGPHHSQLTGRASEAKKKRKKKKKKKKRPVLVPALTTGRTGVEAG